MTSGTATITLQHGTTLDRARLIEMHGPDPHFREPGGGHQPPAEGFSTCIAGTRQCPSGLPERVARDKAALYPDEGGPAILEFVVPDSIMAIHYADEIAAYVAAGGEIRFEPESGLNELRAAWPSLMKRVIPL